jgi:hypothetical protein
MTSFAPLMVITTAMIIVLIWNVLQEGRRHKGRPEMPARVGMKH